MDSAGDDARRDTSMTEGAILSATISVSISSTLNVEIDYISLKSFTKTLDHTFL